MHSLRFTPATSSNGVVERDFTLGEVAGVLWSPASGSEHAPLVEAARRITVPVQFLLPWDDEHVDRQSALALFDAFASKEKTLHANPGDHRNIRWFGLDNGFLARHLGRVDTSPA